MHINIFDVVNELSVFGVTLLMMAVNTIWYSSMLFGSVWSKATGIALDESQASQNEMIRTTLLTFFSYFVALMFIAYGVAVAPLLGVSTYTFAVCTWMFVGAALASVVILEQRSLGYYVGTLGFMGVFIVGGAFILLFWPW